MIKGEKLELGVSDGRERVVVSVLEQEELIKVGLLLETKGKSQVF